MRMRFRTGTLLLGAASLVGCSLLLNADVSQCSRDTDCVGVNAGRVCLAGQCAASALTGDDAGSGTDSAVEASEPACISSEDCTAKNGDLPTVCRADTGRCQQLTSPDCPAVIGDYKTKNALIFGALDLFEGNTPLAGPVVLNYELAIAEFNGAGGGLPGGPAGTRRPLAAVICNVNAAEKNKRVAMHLTETLGVPAIIGPLQGVLLKDMVDAAIPRRVLLMNTGVPDNTVNLATEGLLWHALGDIKDLAPAYAALLARVERYVSPPVDGGAGTPIRVALLSADTYLSQALTDSLLGALRFNGQTPAQNGARFLPLSMPNLGENPNANYSNFILQLQQFKPHVIVSTGTAEVVRKVLPGLELPWDDVAQPRPFWVLGPFNFDADVLGFIASSARDSSEAKRKRFAGVNIAAALDTTLYDNYVIRLRGAYPNLAQVDGYENYYDAVYYLGYGFVAGGNPLTGTSTAVGLGKLQRGGRVDIGPSNIRTGFQALAAGGEMRFFGTMGTTDFDPLSKARPGDGSLFCVRRNGDQSLSFSRDVQRWNRATSTLDGTFSCYSGL